VGALEQDMIYFTSDQHFGHTNVIPYCGRPFKDLDHMHETLIRRHNAVVGPEDTVYHLGDFSLNFKWVEKILPRLNGYKHLIVGNHDACHTVHCATLAKLYRKREQYQKAGFDSVNENIYLELGPDLSALLHHMPYRGDHTGVERYQEYRPADYGGWLIHGHVHGLWRVKDRMINVGVDVWDYAPVPITSIQEIISNAVPTT
jgi:calcineurin-like phosphoesterase family protein